MRILPNVVSAAIAAVMIGGIVHLGLLAIVKTVEQNQASIALRSAGR